MWFSFTSDNGLQSTDVEFLYHKQETDVFFLRRKESGPVKSTNSGTMPSSVPSNWSSAEDTRVPAKARLQETDSMRHHRFLQARNEENRSKGGASRARETANRSTNDSASGLHLPPVSMPTTTSRHRSPAHNSAYFTSFWWRASSKTAPSTAAAFGRARPHAVTALRTVMSTASCAPWFNSRPEASTSIARSSVAGTKTHLVRFLRNQCQNNLTPSIRSLSFPTSQTNQEQE